MRRNRYRREFLDQAIQGKKITPEQRVISLVSGDSKKANYTKPSVYKKTQSKLAKYQKISPIIKKIEKEEELPALNIDFKSFREYTPDSIFISVLHVIDSVGLGGAQVMMLELATALNKYYGNNVQNFILFLNDKEKQKNVSEVFNSYKMQIDQRSVSQIGSYCNHNDIKIVIHHRTAASSCLKQYLPKNTKYILVNHSFYSSALMLNMNKFKYCDVIIPVCSFLHRQLKYPNSIHSTRRITILNGIENDTIKNIQPALLDGSFITGRCQRLSISKFKKDSIKWMDKISQKLIGHKHYIIGDENKIEQECKGFSTCNYLGCVLDKNNKFSIIKKFDLYFYETFQDEGASMSILESLACGVPVLAKPLGGTSELIRDGINGFLVKDRKEFQNRIELLYYDKEVLNTMKKQTLEDFNERLHIKNTACKYMQIIEKI